VCCYRMVSAISHCPRIQQFFSLFFFSNIDVKGTDELFHGGGRLSENLEVIGMLARNTGSFLRMLLNDGLMCTFSDHLSFKMWDTFSKFDVSRGPQSFCTSIRSFILLTDVLQLL